MGKDKGSDLNIKFWLTIIVVTSIWNYVLRGVYHGTLGFRLVIVFSVFRIIQSIIHNIHYDKFVSLYNPFFTLLIIGGYYMLNRTYRYTHIFFTQGLEWFEWFKKDSSMRDIISWWQQLITFPCLLYSFFPYYILYKNIFDKKKNFKDNKEDIDDYIS